MFSCCKKFLNKSICHVSWQETQNLPEAALSVQTEKMSTAMKPFLLRHSAPCLTAAEHPTSEIFSLNKLKANTFIHKLTWTVLHCCFSQPQLWLVFIKHPHEMKVGMQLFRQQSGTLLTAAGEPGDFYLSSPTDAITTPTSRLCTWSSLISA